MYMYNIHYLEFFGHYNVDYSNPSKTMDLSQVDRHQSVRSHIFLKNIKAGILMKLFKHLTL